MAASLLYSSTMNTEQFYLFARQSVKEGTVRIKPGQTYMQTDDFMETREKENTASHSTLQLFIK